MDNCPACGSNEVDYTVEIEKIYFYTKPILGKDFHSWLNNVIELKEQAAYEHGWEDYRKFMIED